MRLEPSPADQSASVGYTDPDGTGCLAAGPEGDQFRLTIPRSHGPALLDEGQARALCDQITEWLKLVTDVAEQDEAS